MTLPRNFPRHEGIVSLTVILLAIAVGAINPGSFLFIISSPSEEQHGSRSFAIDSFSSW
jgi:hypothetical protein